METDGNFRVTETKIPENPPIIYPITDDSLAQLHTILTEKRRLREERRSSDN